MLGRAARQTEYLHVSDLVGKCLRKIAITETLGLPPKAQGLSLTDSLTYGQGEIIHDVMKARIAAGGALLWGNWQCRCGTTKTSSPCLPREEPRISLGSCPACGGVPDVYVEVPMRDEELKIVGTPDILTYLPELTALHITELKSMSHDMWKELVRPVPDHVIQVVFYWFLMQRLGYRLTNRISIVYVTKGWMFSGNPWKEFTLDAQVEIPRLAPYLEDARAIQVSRAGGSLPVRTCANERAPVAKKCEVCKTCFSGVDLERPREISIVAALTSERRR